MLPAVVTLVALSMVNIYSKYQINILNGCRDIAKCYFSARQGRRELGYDSNYQFSWKTVLLKTEYMYLQNAEINQNAEIHNKMQDILQNKGLGLQG